MGYSDNRVRNRMQSKTINCVIFNNSSLLWISQKCLKFEDIEVCVPKDFDAYLTYLYNDWRKWPPKEKQVGHHYDKGLSLTQGYEQYMKEHRI